MSPEPEGAIVSIHAYAFASTFRLRELVDVFADGEAVLFKDELRVSFAGGESAICFDFGAVAFFGVEAARRDAVVRSLQTRVGETQPPRTEDFLIEAANGQRPEVRFDRVRVPELTWPVRAVVGLLLAQSAAMDYYADDLQDILARTDRIIHELAEHGRFRGRVRNLVRFIGGCISTKNEVIETLALFDKPDDTWEDEALDRLYVSLRRMLEIEDRFRALEYRLRVIQENLVLLVDVSQQRSNLLLEGSIVALIVIELLVTILGRVG